MGKLLKTPKVSAIDEIPPANRQIGNDDTWGLVVVARSVHDGNEAARNWHRQSNYALNLVLKGMGKLVRNDGSTSALSPGCVYQHLPRDPREPRVVWNGDAPVAEWFLILDQRLYQRLSATGLFPADDLLRCTHPDLPGLFNALHARLAPLEHIRPVLRLPLVLAEAVYFLGHLFNTALPPEQDDPWARVVNDAREWLDLNPASRDRLPDLARRLGVSYAGLRRAFRAQVGRSLSDYRIARRIDEAKGRLLHADVSAVAAQLGYPDPFTFSSQFKQVTGQSPRSYLRGGRSNPPA